MNVNGGVRFANGLVVNDANVLHWRAHVWLNLTTVAEV